jgi:hypothetical protein
MQIKAAEFFSGTGCWSSSLEQKKPGSTSYTLDHDPKLEPDFVMSIGALRKCIENNNMPGGLDQSLDLVHSAPDW